MRRINFTKIELENISIRLAVSSVPIIFSSILLKFLPFWGILGIFRTIILYIYIFSLIFWLYNLLFDLPANLYEWAESEKDISKGIYLLIKIYSYASIAISVMLGLALFGGLFYGIYDSFSSLFAIIRDII